MLRRKPNNKAHNNKKTGITKRPPLLDFFPEIKPYSSGYMAVDEPHEIYWAQCGNPDGVPIIYLHGGPGGHCSDKAPRFFDPDYYRIILLDQRGAGRSNPHTCLIDNNTDALIRDIEQLRAHLNIEKWHVFGGSWGSTLALSYAAKHANNCISMILRGIFLMEQGDIDWLYKHNKNIWPEAYEQFIGHIPEEEQHDIISAYYKRLTSNDKQIQIEAAIAWSLYESSCSSLTPNYEIITTDNQKEQALSISIIECHYFKHHIIPPENSLLNQVDKFRHIPTTIVQGRYDCICPISSAQRLHAAWPEADYIIVPDGGHSAMDPPIRSRLIAAAEHAKTIR